MKGLEPYYWAKPRSPVICILGGQLPAPVDDMAAPVDLRSTVEGCWSADPAARPTAQLCYEKVKAEVREHEGWAE